MSSAAQKPDMTAVLAGLKDFQRRTVNYAFQRLYLDQDNPNRFLVADDVGLGKTHVARGLIARAVDHLWDSTARIDILYICANQDIARQNIDRLAIPGLNQYTPADRITLLPLRPRGSGTRNFKDEKVNFIPLTPGTSLDMRSHYGRWEERVLLLKLISDVLDLPPRGARVVFSARIAYTRFVDHYIAEFESRYTIDESLAAAFQDAFLSEAGAALRAELLEQCERHKRRRTNVPPAEMPANRDLISSLRHMLAEVCAAALEPDLIILDEFQRFKDVLNDTNPVGALAQTLFRFEEARTLLLSATPYKMYTLYDEADVDDHYRDFLETMRFLYHKGDETAVVRTALARYRQALLGAPQHDNAGRALAALRTARDDLRRTLLRVMVRTEKLAASTDGNAMLREVPPAQVHLETGDLTAYVALARVAETLQQPNPFNYWKSAPYLLNFMDEYQLKRAFGTALLDGDGRRTELTAALRAAPQALLDGEQVAGYQALNPANARLRALLADIVEAGAWQLLWLPPSLPYYEAEAAFAQPGLAALTKRLVFSAWFVVPKTIAALVSYEAERRIVEAARADLRNSVEARKSLGQLLRLAREKDGRLAGMPVLALMLPSAALAAAGDPLALRLTGNGRLPTLAEVRAAAVVRIKALLAQHNLRGDTHGPVDERWYWAAPILLDLAEYPRETRAWWAGENLAAAWTGASGDEDDTDDGSQWEAHVAQGRLLARGFGFQGVGRQPDDLAEVLADLAIAGPGVCALRALARSSGASLLDPALRKAAASVGWAFRSLFNGPEVTLLLRALYQDEHEGDSYWRLTLRYAAAGNLQAVLDEYAHLLHESWDKSGQAEVETAMRVAGAMRDVIRLRPATLKTDHYHLAANSDGFEASDLRFRSHFAMRFGDSHGEDDQKGQRKELVRQAFNSPFWPFVLATTSVGQEGLDFHLYCHALVHWNLPANPVDLEQREGRIHRYKGHAIRKNLVHDLADRLQPNGGGDIWQELFRLGREAADTDLVPFWIYPAQGEPFAAIERHVPAMPLSREAGRLDVLRRALTAYRMAFGQNRQEDLVNYLLQWLSPDEVVALAQEGQIDLSPPDVS